MIRAVILANEIPEDHILWIKACDAFKHEITYKVVNIFSDDWLEKIKEINCDILLLKPPGISSLFKQVYDERTFILNRVLNYTIYPTLSEVLIYENKRFFYSWLKANKLSHPETHIFLEKENAIEFAENTKFPIVTKTNIGASGSGVKILENKKECLAYVKKVFSDQGIKRRWGPNWAKGNLIKRGLQYLKEPKDIKVKLEIYNKVRKEVQKDFVIFQKYIPHDFEWRVVAIDDSYFAHKKLKIGEKASGTTLKKYDNPPLKLFYFAKEIMDKFNFTSQAFDIFETNSGELLINEMQCIFGQSDPYQMLMDGIPGRYRFIKDKWIFEKGDFNKNESYNLRVEHVIKLLKDV